MTYLWVYGSEGGMEPGRAPGWCVCVCVRAGGGGGGELVPLALDFLFLDLYLCLDLTAPLLTTSSGSPGSPAAALLTQAL